MKKIKIVLTDDDKVKIKTALLAGLIATFLIVGLMILFNVTTPQPAEKITNVSDSISGQGNLKEQYQQPDAKTVADKWPMKPPKVVVLSDWSVHMQGDPYYRYVEVAGQLAIEVQNPNRVSSYYTATIFLPEVAVPK